MRKSDSHAHLHVLARPVAAAEGHDTDVRFAILVASTAPAAAHRMSVAFAAPSHACCNG